MRSTLRLAVFISAISGACDDGAPDGPDGGTDGPPASSCLDPATLSTLDMHVEAPVRRGDARGPSGRARGDRVLPLPRDGLQASLLCLVAAAAAEDAIDGLALAGLPADFATTFAFGATDPSLYYAMPFLGSTANPEMLAALVAPRPLSLVGPPARAWSFAQGVYSAAGAGDALDLAPEACSFLRDGEVSP